MPHAHGDIRRRNVPITDLDHSDGQEQRRPPKPAHGGKSREATTSAPTEDARKVHRYRRPAERAALRTISANFNRRARSADCLEVHDRPMVVEGERHTKPTKWSSHINELLQTKDKQMEKLLERLALLHQFNEQFAEENRKLRDDITALEAGGADLRQRIADCKRCRQLGQQLEQEHAKNKTLSVDIEMMKTLVYRLNVQIEHHHDQLRLLNGGDHAPPLQPPHTKSSLPPYKQDEPVRSHTLDPLLRSYDEMLRDKQQLIQTYQLEFDHFTGELKRVLEENTRLLSENEQLKRDFLSWREERTRLRAQANVCHQKAEAQSRKSDLAKEKLVEVMHCYEQKTQELVLELEHVQSAYVRCKTELAQLKTQSAPQPSGAISHALADCKEQIDQMRQAHSRTIKELEKTIAELTERNGSQSDKLEKMRKEKESLKTALEQHSGDADELRRRTASLQRSHDKVAQSRDRLKARLRIALQWAQKLEQGQTNVQNTWDELKRLETIVKHRESQVRGLQSRHIQEIDKMHKRLAQKEETIRTILKGKLAAAGSAGGAGCGGGRGRGHYVKP